MQKAISQQNIRHLLAGEEKEKPETLLSHTVCMGASECETARSACDILHLFLGVSDDTI